MKMIMIMNSDLRWWFDENNDNDGSANSNNDNNNNSEMIMNVIKIILKILIILWTS